MQLCCFIRILDINNFNFYGSYWINIDSKFLYVIISVPLKLGRIKN